MDYILRLSKYGQNFNFWVYYPTVKHVVLGEGHYSKMHLIGQKLSHCSFGLCSALEENVNFKGVHLPKVTMLRSPVR